MAPVCPGNYRSPQGVYDIWVCGGGAAFVTSGGVFTALPPGMEGAAGSPGGALTLLADLACFEIIEFCGLFTVMRSLVRVDCRWNRAVRAWLNKYSHASWHVRLLVSLERQLLALVWMWNGREMVPLPGYSAPRQRVAHILLWPRTEEAAEVIRFVTGRYGLRTLEVHLTKTEIGEASTTRAESRLFFKRTPDSSAARSDDDVAVFPAQQECHGGGRHRRRKAPVRRRAKPTPPCVFMVSVTLYPVVKRFQLLRTSLRVPMSRNRVSPPRHALRLSMSFADSASLRNRLLRKRHRSSWIATATGTLRSSSAWAAAPPVRSSLTVSRLRQRLAYDAGIRAQSEMARRVAFYNSVPGTGGIRISLKR